MITEFKEISNSFLSELNKIQTNNTGILDCANRAIILSRDVLHIFKKKLVKSKFLTLEEEVHFFKTTKQIVLKPLIYYSEIRSFELQYPKANIQTQKKYVRRKLENCNRFFAHNLDFVQYVENEQTHFDLHYYTRKFLDSLPIVSSKFYFQDPDFTTARDMLLGKTKAYKELIGYLQNRLSPKAKGTKKSSLNGTSHTLKWTASKAALTELIYALHCNSAINNGNSNIKELAEELQNILQFDLGDFYKTFSQIKSRKISRTKFLDDLSLGLITQMDKLEN